MSVAKNVNFFPEEKVCCHVRKQGSYVQNKILYANVEHIKMYYIVSFLDIIFGTCIIFCNIMSAFIDLKFFQEWNIYTDRIEKYTCIYTISKSWNICPSKIEKDHIMSDLNISKSRNIISAAITFEKSFYAHVFNCEKLWH